MSRTGTRRGEKRGLERRTSNTQYVQPTPPHISRNRESASSITESVELLFPGVEHSYLVQIIENRFKLTNIYRLLATALFIYTMNLYDLWEKYTWNGVKAYDFQLQRKRVASGKGIYYPSEWRHIDSELIASRSFAHPHIPLSQWTSSQNCIVSFPRRSYELPIPVTHFSTASPHTGNMPSSFPASSDRRSNTYHTGHSTSTATQAGNRSVPITTQVCRNWNYRECRSAYCRNQHICINSGSNH